MISSAPCACAWYCSPHHLITWCTCCIWRSSRAWRFRKPSLVVLLGLGTRIRGWVTKSGRFASKSSNPVQKKTQQAKAHYSSHYQICR
ncbi:hypothetical protein GDO81_022265 [Engystomops pustulosus]|uniref:Secreted protein n=1 Tax=Engystomops pustulosus TaxID=76066 RepID=A0AAV6Z4M7_ENGPU|nr:hypothetical protein GDO81_022265 [Engystomops pustulosus]